jgi:hypothetical protein
MAGYQLYRALQELEQEANDLGFMFSFSQYRYDSGMDLIALKPLEDKLPIYSRDAELYTSDHNEVKAFLQGVKWARAYDSMIGATSNKRRQQYEAKEVARLERIRYNKAKAETFKTLKEEHV